MKNFFQGIAVMAGLFVVMNVVMFFLGVCPPQGPWPMPPWCQDTQQEASGLPDRPMVTKAEIITPFSDQEVSIIVNDQVFPLTRVNEIYAEGLIEIAYNEPYTIMMGDRQKSGIFTGGYLNFIMDARATGNYAYTDLPISEEFYLIEEFLFDHLPKEGTGRAMDNGFYLGAGGNAPVMAGGQFFDKAAGALPKIKETGAEWINLVPMWFFFPYEDSSIRTSSELRPIYRDEFYTLEKTGYNYPTFDDQELKDFIRLARAQGLKVYLVPHITPVNWGPETMAGKASLQVDDIDVFFENYRNMIVHYAKIAEEAGVELLGIGCENDSLTIQEQNVYPGVNLTQKWYGVIDSAREHYSGKLTYSAAAGDLYYSAPNQVRFWDALDYIGFEWYIPLTDNKEAGIAELTSLAEGVIERLVEPLHRRYGKPVLLAEVGFEGKPYAWTRSYEGSAMDRGYDRLAAAICYEYLFRAIENYEYIEGMFIWSWQPHNDPENLFPQDIWWAIANDGNEVQHSIIQPQISKWFAYYKGR